MPPLCVQCLENSARYVPHPLGPEHDRRGAPALSVGCWPSSARITGKEHWEPKTGIALPVAVPSFLVGSGLILLVQTYNIIMILACFFFSLPHLK